jgi:hypothetical protein
LKDKLRYKKRRKVLNSMRTPTGLDEAFLDSKTSYLEEWKDIWTMAGLKD